MASHKHRLAVLVSGNGTNLQAIIDQIDAGAIDARISAVISNVDNARGLERAARANIATAVLEHARFESRDAFDRALIELLDSYRPDTVLLAGFMRILTPAFVSHYAGRVLNIHPSLLPQFQGLNTHQRVLDAGETRHGCSVHFVTDELDGGPVIAQASLDVDATDTAASLAERVLKKEHVLYPMVVRWVAERRVTLAHDGVWLDGRKLGAQGFQLEDG